MVGGGRYTRVVEEGYRHRPPCHLVAILSRMFSPFPPGYTVLDWLTALVNGALLCGGCEEGPGLREGGKPWVGRLSRLKVLKV